MQTRNAASLYTPLLSRCFSWGEQQRDKGPCREVLCCPLVLGFGPAQLWFFSGKPLNRRRESGKVVLLQSYEGPGGLEALTWTAERGTGWRGMCMQLSEGPGSSLASVWAMRPPSPWHQRSLLGDSCPFSMLVARGWDGGSVPVPVAAPRELLVPHQAPKGSSTSRAPSSLTSLTDRGVYGESVVLRAFLYKATVLWSLAEPSRRTLYCLH